MIALLMLVQQVVASDTTIARPDSTSQIKIGAFIDAYYAWDFGDPGTRDRSFAGGALFTTQPARHNEFNVNLAFIEARIERDRVRGRLAAQFGTSVVSNYSSEPTTGAVSGPSAARYLQEAYAGWQIAPSLWVDGGVFFSHVGMEGWISRDNPTYTRSLVAEYSPYYQSGVRAIWTPRTNVSARVDFVNGWQNISENNSGKGAGLRVDYAVTPNVSLSYYNLFSDESDDRLRSFNGVGAKTVVGRWTLLGEADVGTQRRSTAAIATWYGYTAVARTQLTSTLAIAGRIERFDDNARIVAFTGTDGRGRDNPPFRGNGASLGIDVSPMPNLVWRSEARVFRNSSAIFPRHDSVVPTRSATFVVTSLGLTL